MSNDPTPCQRCFAVSGDDDYASQWDWRCLLPSSCWHRASFGGYPGWDAVPDQDTPRRHPPFVMLECTRGQPGESDELAKAWDDVGVDVFYCRDWTSSGIPFVDDGAKYWSGFWFARMADAMEFHAKHGGAASWRLDYIELRDAMRERRQAG